MAARKISGNCRQNITDVVVRLSSDVEIDWNIFQALSLTFG
jgi:hypothetical protein